MACILDDDEEVYAMGYERLSIGLLYEARKEMLEGCLEKIKYCLEQGKKVQKELHWMR